MAEVKTLKIIRFLTGEEIIGEVVGETDTTIDVKNALRIVMIPTKTQGATPQIGLAPFLQWSDDKVLTMNRGCVITMATPIEDFVNQYNSAFGGIVVPK